MYSRVYVEIGNVCNMNCSFCHGTSREPRQMNFSEFQYAVKSIRHLTDYLYLHVMGEPLMHPELINFIGYASSLGFKCAITTNGTLLKKRGEELLKSGVYKVNISLHSFENGSRAAEKKYLDTCLDFADKASELGILSVLRLWNGEGSGGKNAFGYSEIREKFSDCEWVYGKRGARIKHRLHLEYGERFEWPDIGIESLGDRVFCYGLSDHFGILSSGDVVPCCLDGDGVIKLGNIFSSNIDEILSSERAENMRRGFRCKTASEELCKRCGYARRFKV